jgi:hypothetical protein
MNDRGQRDQAQQKANRQLLHDWFLNIGITQRSNAAKLWWLRTW